MCFCTKETLKELQEDTLYWKQNSLWPKKLSNLTFMLINLFIIWSLGGLRNIYKDGSLSNYLHCLFVFFRWPAGLETSINAQDPLNISGEGTSVYLSSSPPQFCPQGREIDIDAIRDHSQITKKIIFVFNMRRLFLQNFDQNLISRLV